MNRLIYISIVLLENLHELDTGLCGLALRMDTLNKLSEDDVDLFKAFIEEQFPNVIYPWIPGQIEPRANFLADVIYGRISVPKTSDVLAEILLHKHLIEERGCLCNAVASLAYYGELTPLEKQIFDEYVWRNKPCHVRLFNNKRGATYWRYGKVKPRVRWLKKHIKKCKKRGD